jgi:hypothetical protein
LGIFESKRDRSCIVHRTRLHLSGSTISRHLSRRSLSAVAVQSLSNPTCGYMKQRPSRLGSKLFVVGCSTGWISHTTDCTERQLVAPESLTGTVLAESGTFAFAVEVQLVDNNLAYGCFTQRWTILTCSSRRQRSASHEFEKSM